MIAVRTRFTASHLPSGLGDVRSGIERRIPLGAGSFNKKLTDTLIPRL
jgi:tRNA-splicing ligase RtcB